MRPYNPLTMTNPSKSAASRKRVQPRHAASLMVYRQQGDQIEVLLGKRHARARFAPDVYVFPGGAVDAADFEADTPEPAQSAHMGVGNKPALARALLQAAVREAREETGLNFRPNAGLHNLRYIGRAITPVFSPVRYHARFFAAPAHLFEGAAGVDGALAGDGELQPLHWVSVQQALGYPLIDVTVFMLQELQQELLEGRTRLPLFTYYGNGPRVLYRDC